MASAAAAFAWRAAVSRVEAVYQGRDERAGVRVARSVEVDGVDGVSGHHVQRAVLEQEAAIGAGADQGGSAREPPAEGARGVAGVVRPVSSAASRLLQLNQSARASMSSSVGAGIWSASGPGSTTTVVAASISGQPGAERGPVRRVREAVAGDVDDVVRSRSECVEVIDAERGLCSGAGDEGPFAFCVDQADDEAGVPVGARGQQDLNALRAQRRTDLVAEGTGAVRSRIDDRDALARGRGHDVEAAAWGGRRARGEDVAAALGKVGDFEEDIDDRVAGVQ